MNFRFLRPWGGEPSLLLVVWTEVVSTSMAVSMAAVLAVAVPPFVPNVSHAPNMNGEYILSATPHGQVSKFPKAYRDYPGGVEQFEVYSPLISQLYSQVFWKGLDPVDLPPEIVQRYAGRGMAIVGFEMDQVMRSAGPDGGDLSVPITHVYNHHFESSMVGAKSQLEKVVFSGPDDPRIAELEARSGHGIPSHEEHWVVRDLAPDNPIPTSMAFGGANGGEYRKSYHGYAPGYAQVIDSPERFQITPMQVSTHRAPLCVCVCARASRSRPTSPPLCASYFGRRASFLLRQYDSPRPSFDPPPPRPRGAIPPHPPSPPRSPLPSPLALPASGRSIHGIEIR
jgi:hypothetical protein